MTIKLTVPYYSQLNNDTNYFGSGYRQCNLTTHAMLVAYLVPDFVAKSIANDYDEPESYYGSKLIKYGDTTDHNAHTECLAKEFSIKSNWTTNLSKSEIIEQLNKNIPVPIGVDYKASGHIILIVGLTDSGVYIHDPYGIRQSSTNVYDVGANGAYDTYSWNLLNQILFDSPDTNGWGRIVTK